MLRAPDAFDRVRLWVLKLLRLINIDLRIQETVKKMNTKNITRGRSENQLTKKVPIYSSKRQGDSLILIFSNLMIDIIKEIKTARRGSRERKIEKLKYAGMWSTWCSYWGTKTTYSDYFIGFKTQQLQVQYNYLYQ